MRRLALLPLLLSVIAACGDDDVAADSDTVVADTVPADTVVADTGSADSAALDTTVADSGEADTSAAIDTVEDTAQVDTSLPPLGDDDGDGILNGDELLDGTDPLDPSSARAWHPEISARPRLFFEAADVPALAALIGSEPDGTILWARIMARANAAIPQLPEPGVWDDHVAQGRGAIAEAAAFVGLVDGNVTYTDKAAAILADPLPSPHPLNVGLYPESKYDLREAEALVAACHAFDLLAGTPGAEALVPGARETLSGRVDDFAVIHLEQGAFYRFLFLAQNNHLMKVMGALGVCAVALPDRPGAAAEFNEGVTALTHMMLEYQGHPEGGYAEGWNYLAYGGQTWLPLVWTYQRLVGAGSWPLMNRGTVTPYDERAGEVHLYGDLAAEETVRRIFDNALRTARPDGLMVPTDDANAVPLHGIVLAALFDQPVWRWNWDKPAVNRYSNAANVLSFIALLDAPAAAPPTFTLDEAFAGAGFVNMRSDWSPEATYLHMLVEHGLVRANGIGHEHADSLSFLLHAHGEPLVLDPGYINFDHHDLVKHGKDHNIVLVDGAGPSFPLSVSAPGGDAFLEDWDDDAQRTTALGRTNFADTDWWRRVVRVDGGWFLVADRVEADAEHTYTWALNGNAGGEVPDGNFTLAADGATWARPKASLRVVVTPTEGTPTLAERLEEHAPAWGQQQLHSCLDVHADMGTTGGFLSLLWPSPTGAALPTFSASSPSDGRAELRVDYADGTYEIATLDVADALLTLKRHASDGTLEQEDAWPMQSSE